MAKTGAAVSVDSTQELAQNTVTEGTTVNVSSYYDGYLQIWWALCNATAHTGTRLIIQTSLADSGDEDWATLTSLVVGVGTTNLEVITNDPATAGTTVFTCADTTGYSVGTWIFLEDVSTFANSEWLWITTVTSNTSVTALDGSTREHAVSSILNSVAGVTPPISIPFAARRLRVVYDNKYDSDGATVAVKAKLVNVTAV